MQQNKLYLYNTKTQRKELFIPLHKSHVGMYVCGPTVYGEAHLGNARPAIVFDVLFRYLSHLGFKVRYVRNITDVGHLIDDSETGEDKLIKRAKIEKLEPIEVAEKYIRIYRKNMTQLNILEPSIEPRATAHIIEQQEMIQKIIDNGFAYPKNGSVYFDIKRFNQRYNNYGDLSGRKVDDLLEFTRTLQGQNEKKNPFDFALWKNADTKHLMRWKSPWGYGFPGWHLECSSMSEKYLGEVFDIHGGGLDLTFPHHECEIAQSIAANGKANVRYWVHNNLITVNGKKMAKSLDNFITLNELFSRGNGILEKAFSPMVVRFFIMQAHYRNTLDFSNNALTAAEQGLHRLMSCFDTFTQLKPSPSSTFDVNKFMQKCYNILNDDLNTAILIAHLFDGIKLINQVASGKESLTEKDINQLKDVYEVFVINILGLKPFQKTKNANNRNNDLLEILLNVRQELKEEKLFSIADMIRDKLIKAGFEIKDTPQGVTWKTK